MSDYVKIYTDHFLGTFSKKLGISVAVLRQRLASSKEFRDFCGEYGDQYMKCHRALCEIIESVVTDNDKVTKPMQYFSGEEKKIQEHVQTLTHHVTEKYDNRYIELLKIYRKDVSKYTSEGTVEELWEKNVSDPREITAFIVMELVGDLCLKYPRMKNAPTMKNVRTQCLNNMISRFVTNTDPVQLYTSYKNTIFNLEGDKLDNSMYYPNRTEWERLKENKKEKINSFTAANARNTH